MRAVAILAASFGGMALLGAACDGPPPPPATLSSIQENIFVPRCGASVCHGGAGPVDGLDLVGDPFGTLVNVDSVEVAGKKRVVPGDPDNSLLFLVLQGPVSPVEKMPQGDPEGLDAAELDQIKQWIDDGAEDN